MNFRNTLTILLISGSYLLIWGFSFLQIDIANQFTVFGGMMYTILAVYLFKNYEFIRSNNFYKLFLLVFPTFYLVLSLIILKKNSVYLLNPILWAFVVLIISLKYLNSINFKSLIIITIFSGLYAYYLYPIFRYPSKAVVSESDEIEKKDLKLTKLLQSYSFLKNDHDTIQLIDKNKLILVETWNETCLPCLAAMNDLQPLMDSLSTSLKHYYLYENSFKNHSFPHEKIYNFQKIIDKSKIILDLDNRFLTESKMSSYPYFLLFDSEGKLVDYFKGYNPKFKEYFINRLRGMANKK